MAEQVTFSRSALPGVTALRARGSTRLWRASHDRLCITIVHAGAGEWSMRGKHFSIEPTRLMVMQPGDVHQTTQVTAAGSFDALYVEDELLGRYFGDSLRTRRLPRLTPSVDSAPVLSAFRSILSADWQNDRGRVLDNLTSALGSLLDAQPESALDLTADCDTRLRRAKNEIAERYRSEPFSPVNIERVAETLGVDYFWLHRRFKQHFRVTPYQYAMSLRFVRARELLLHGRTHDLPTLEAVAFRAGYSSYTHMAREFKSAVGLRPRDLASEVGGWDRRR